MSQKDYELVSEISGKLKKLARPAGISWKGSPFEWIKLEPSSSRRGKIGAELVSEWCMLRRFEVKPSLNSHSDRRINGFRIEIKFSTLWGTGHYRFQQIRNQDYDYMFCLGISPKAIHAWFIPKSVLLSKVIGHTGQHSGKGAKETAMLHFPVKDAPVWMKKYGGTLADVQKLIRKAGKGPH